MLMMTRARWLWRDLRDIVDTYGPALPRERVEGLRNHYGVTWGEVVEVAEALGATVMRPSGEAPAAYRARLRRDARSAEADGRLELGPLTRASILSGAIYRIVGDPDEADDETSVWTTLGQFRREREALAAWVAEVEARLAEKDAAP